MIVKCCASCKFRESKGDEKYRYCKLGKGKHVLSYLCGSSWEMDERLDNAGKGGGRVKKKAYIDFTVKYGFGLADVFEREYGSRYLTKK